MERRGVPCVHFEYGEAEAILSALALINRAYALIWRAVATVSREAQQRAMDYIEKLLGVHGLLNGQSLDLHYSTMAAQPRDDRENCAWQDCFSDPAHTGSACDAGRRFGTGNATAGRIALYWGLAYQMTDDLKDMLDSQATAGKTVARDLLLDRPNTAFAMGIPASIERLIRFIDVGDRSLASLLLSRLGLSFLTKLRDSLEEELARITANLREMPSGARS